MAKDQHPNEPQDRKESAKAPSMTDERRSYLASTYGLTRDQVTVIRNVICVDATDEELEFFLATAKRLELDPFARQIWFVKRRQKIEDAFGNELWVEVGKPETSIDGFRTVAERSGQYRGQTPMEWCDAEGRWSEVWLASSPPSAARATVIREGFTERMRAVAHWAEYCPVIKTKTGSFIPKMWLKMPANQLSKCAEALAFRRAFPRDLSGIYVDTEMEHATAEAAGYSAPSVVSAPPMAAKSANGGTPPQLEERKESVLDAALKRRIEYKEAIAEAPELAVLRPIGEALSAMQAALDGGGTAILTREDLAELKPDFEARWRDLSRSGKKR